LPDHYDPAWFAPRVFAEQRAFALAYDELRAIARYLIRGEIYSPTLQATELVHQAFVKLYTSPIGANDRQHFLALLSRYMRQVLIERARRRGAEKRDAVQVPLSDAVQISGETEPPWELVDAQLTRLAEADPVLAQVFELRYFAGLSHEDLARHLDKSPRTVKRYWRAARAWMSEQLRNELALRIPEA
jgi:RNA polymerase sigma factor (TIGR02999 family)